MWQTEISGICPSSQMIQYASKLGQFSKILALLANRYPDDLIDFS